MAATPDGSQAVSASDDKMLKVWNLETGMLVADFRADESISTYAVTADGRTFVAVDEAGQVHILRLEKGLPAGEYGESGDPQESKGRSTNAEDEQILAWFKDVNMDVYRNALQVFWCIGHIEGDAMKSAERALGWGSLSKRLREDLDPHFKLAKLPTGPTSLSKTCIPNLDGLFDRPPFHPDAWTDESDHCHYGTSSRLGTGTRVVGRSRHGRLGSTLIAFLRSETCCPTSRLKVVDIAASLCTQ